MTMAMKYLHNVATVQVRQEACVGCGMCLQVCPHQVLTLRERKAAVADRDACMECGACARNCPVQAISVDAGVGCASAIISGMLHGTAPECACSGGKECC